MNSSPLLHHTVGKWMLKKFSLNYRTHALFCTGDSNVASSYTIRDGFILIKIKPLGDYSLCFSPNCRDLFAEFQFRQISTQNDIIQVIESLEYVEYKNCGLEEASASKCEVMLYAQQFEYQRVN